MARKKSEQQPGVGHNSGESVDSPALKAFIERIERLDEDREAIVEDIKSVFAEAKDEGFDPKIMKKVLARRKKDREKVREEDALIETYESALGVFG